MRTYGVETRNTISTVVRGAATFVLTKTSQQAATVRQRRRREVGPRVAVILHLRRDRERTFCSPRCLALGGRGEQCLMGEDEGTTYGCREACLFLSLEKEGPRAQASNRGLAGIRSDTPRTSGKEYRLLNSRQIKWKIQWNEVRPYMTGLTDDSSVYRKQ